MFLSFTPNPCLERTLQIPSLAVQASQRIDQEAVSVSLGGKGLNAARVAARFGAPVRAIAPVGARQLSTFHDLAQSEGVAADFVSVQHHIIRIGFYAGIRMLQIVGRIFYSWIIINHY